jgi:hypothetical protein
MAILRKLVIKIKILGARESSVKRRRSWREKATSLPLSGFLIVRSINGTGVVAGGAGTAMVPSVALPGNGTLGGVILGKGGVWAPTLKGKAVKMKLTIPAIKNTRLILKPLKPFPLLS